MCYNNFSPQNCELNGVLAVVTYTAVRKRSVRLPVDDQARNELARRRVRLSSRAPRHTPPTGRDAPPRGAATTSLLPWS